MANDEELTDHLFRCGGSTNLARGHLGPSHRYRPVGCKQEVYPFRHVWTTLNWLAVHIENTITIEYILAPPHRLRPGGRVEETPTRTG